MEISVKNNADALIFHTALCDACGMEIIMGKYHFIIIGAGWRALYYVRIAKAMPDIFCLDAVYCRTQEKADKIAREYQIHTTTSKEECAAYKPDFAVIAVNKAEICNVAVEWMD